MERFKMYTYKNNGDRDKTLFFDTLSEMFIEYQKRFDYNRFSLNPLCFMYTAQIDTFLKTGHTRYYRIAWNRDGSINYLW